MDGIEASTNTIELTVPELGDLGERAIVAGWNKRVGERVTVDEPICRLAVGDLEFEVCSTADGEVTQIFADQGVGVLENTSLAQVRVDAPAEAEPVPQEPASDDASAAADDGAPSPKVESIEVEPLDPEFAPPQPGDEEADVDAEADEPVVKIDQVEIDPEFAPPTAGDDEPEADEPVVKIEVEPIDPEFAPPQPDQAEPVNELESVNEPEPPPPPSSPDPANPATGLAPKQPQADVAPPAGGLELQAEPEAPPRADLPPARPEPPSQAQPPSQPDAPGPAEPPPPTAAEPPPPPGASELPSGDDVDWSGWISPVVQALADEHDLSLGEIRGTGIGGRIRKRDVLKYLESRDRGF